MNKNLLIVGAGTYGVVAKEIAEDMGCFEKIAFVDDGKNETPEGEAVIGKAEDIGQYYPEFGNIIVAIGNSEIRMELLKKIEDETPYKIVNLVSPRAYIATSAQIMKGCIVEPMAVIQTGSILSDGCIVSAGAVVNHISMLQEGVHIDCGAIVEGYTTVPAGTKVRSGTVYKEIKPHGPLPINGLEYSFESGM